MTLDLFCRKQRSLELPCDGLLLLPLPVVRTAPALCLVDSQFKQTTHNSTHIDFLFTCKAQLYTICDLDTLSSRSSPLHHVQKQLRQRLRHIVSSPFGPGTGTCTDSSQLSPRENIPGRICRRGRQAGFRSRWYSVQDTCRAVRHQGTKTTAIAFKTNVMNRGHHPS